MNVGMPLALLGLILVSAGCTGAIGAPLDALPATMTAPAGPAQPPPPGMTPAPPAQNAGNWTYLTGGRTWQRPLADPRWPAFSASYRFQDNGRHLDSYEHLSAGDTIALARGPVELRGRALELELAIQAGVFSVFDPSFEQSLIIIDYTAGAYAAARSGRASGMLRLWHISGHVGDEFLLEDRYDIDARTPYKFEAVQVLGSWDLPAGFRAYGGPSVLFGVNPSEFGDVIVHAGLEWRAQERLLGIARPVAGADLQMVEGLDFNPDLSVRVGLSFDGGLRGPAFSVLGEVYTGRDPNGELFSDRVSFAGIGFYFNL
jgi:hypothetical protein